MGKERFEVLLEEIRDKVQVVAEGHDVLRSEIKQMEERLTNKFGTDLTGVKIALNNRIEAFHSSLKSEIKVTATILGSKIEEAKEELGTKIDGIDRKLDLHIKQPAHT